MIAATSDANAGERSVDGPVAIGAGAALVVIGIAGLVAAAHHAAGPGGDLLGTLRVALPHSAAHLGAGAALVAAAILGARQARRANIAVGAGCLLLCLVGLTVAGAAPNPLALDSADNALHLALGAVLTAAGLGAHRARR